PISDPDPASPPQPTATLPSQPTTTNLGGDLQGNDSQSIGIPQSPSTSVTTVPSALPDSTPTTTQGGSANHKPHATPTSATFTLSGSPGPAAPAPTESSGGGTASLGVSHHVNAGAIASGVLGALAFLALAFLAFVFLRRRKRRRTAPSAEFLNKSFQPAFVSSAAASYYPFGSVHATSSNNRSSISHTPTIKHGFTLPANNRP
ncbi:hypothetical protein DXG01_001076, partial [Tephrocybe rancida]